MEKTLVYTFKTFPYKSDLPFKKVSVFGKLNDDIKSFCQGILIAKPNWIVGFAKSTEKYSTIEKYSINKFHGDKKVLDDAPDRYELNVPIGLEKFFSVRTKPTKSFCNLSMFKIKWFLEKNNLDIPLTFIHILQNDLKKLPKYLNQG